MFSNYQSGIEAQCPETETRRGKNITSLKRYDYNLTAPVLIDAFNYVYNTPTLNNRLDQLVDYGTNLSGYTDIKNTTTPKIYTYDPIGNLIEDTDEGLSIEWNLQGKVSRIDKAVGGQTTTLQYTYDAFGNRVAKSTTIGSALPTYEYYAKDMQGNTMAQYTRTAGTGSTQITIYNNELTLYGNARIGVLGKNIKYYNGPASGIPSNYIPVSSISSYVSRRNVGSKSYELADHLGNVRNIISDLRLSSKSGTTSPNIIFFNFATEDKSIYNYYAFGMPKTSPYDYKYR
ncbi:MAG: hypothetical protein R2831_06395 [Chitinophagaceae bacterium]